jgi:CelD/BcsL family acetyltransferase involved in cellulose biosynthesis
MDYRYEIELIDTDAGLQSLEAEWTQLYARSTPRNPFLSYEWTAACRRHHCPQSELFVLTARSGGELVAVAPLRRDHNLSFRVLRFIGDGRSDYLGFLHDARHSSAPSALLEHLEERRGESNLAVLRQLAEPYSTLSETPTPGHLRTADVEGTVAPHLAFSGDWDALLKSGPGWLKRMAKASRKWVKDGGSVMRVPGDEAAGYVDQIAEIEAHSWKGEEGVARFQPGPGQELLRQALATLAPCGELELWLAWKEGQPVAFEVNFLAPGRIWLYQGAYRTEFRKYSPGGVLDFLSIERAWKEGAREYDFMSGDEPYKAERTVAERPIRYRALHPSDVRGHLAYGLLLAPRWTLKGYPAARAAHQLWTQARSNPASVLESLLEGGRARLAPRASRRATSG